VAGARVGAVVIEVSVGLVVSEDVSGATVSIAAIGTSVGELVVRAAVVVVVDVASVGELAIGAPVEAADSGTIVGFRIGVVAGANVNGTCAGEAVTGAKLGTFVNGPEAMGGSRRALDTGDRVMGASGTGRSVTGVKVAMGAKLGVRSGGETLTSGAGTVAEMETGGSTTLGACVAIGSSVTGLRAVERRGTGAPVIGVSSTISLLGAVVGNRVGSFVGGSVGLAMGASGSRIVLTGSPKGSYVTLSTIPHVFPVSNRAQNNSVTNFETWHCGGQVPSSATGNGLVTDSRSRRSCSKLSRR
jgi:hypothetical protein